SVNACFLRTQWASRCVCSEESISCVTCAPESENVTHARGCFMISSASSWSSLATGIRKKRSRSFSSARSIMAWAGWTPRSAATSATERCGPSTVSNTKSHSYGCGRASVPSAFLSGVSFVASTSFFLNSGSRSFAIFSASGSLRSSFQSGSRSNGIWVLNDSSAESERLCAWANMRPPSAAVSSSSAMYLRQTPGTPRRPKTPNVIGRQLSLHRAQVILGGGLLEGALAHHVGAQRRVPDVARVVDALGQALERVEELGEGRPAPVDPRLHRLRRDVLGSLKIADDEVLVLGRARRQREAAVAHHDRRDPVVAGRGPHRIPEDLRVHVGVAVHEAGRDHVAFGV